MELTRYVEGRNLWNAIAEQNISLTRCHLFEKPIRNVAGQMIKAGADHTMLELGLLGAKIDKQRLEDCLEIRVKRLVEQIDKEVRSDTNQMIKIAIDAAWSHEQVMQSLRLRYQFYCDEQAPVIAANEVKGAYEAGKAIGRKTPKKARN